MEHDPYRWLGQLTAVMIRGYTELCGRVDEDMSCVVVERDGTPCPVPWGVTMAGVENLCPAIAAGLADLASRRQKSTGDQTLSGTDA